MSTTATPPAAGTTLAKAKQQTAYHILEKGAGNAYEIVARNQKAANADAAIRAHVKETKREVGTWIAIPSRSWVERSVKVETKTSITLT